jgi:hypothetical protein
MRQYLFSTKATAAKIYWLLGFLTLGLNIKNNLLRTGICLRSNVPIFFSTKAFLTFECVILVETKALNSFVEPKMQFLRWKGFFRNCESFGLKSENHSRKY